MRTTRRFQQSGASLVEFALVAFAFFLVFFAILEFGRAFYVRNSVQHLTRCIAREAVVCKATTAGAARAKEKCLIEVAVENPPGSGSYSYSYYWPFVGIATNDFSIQYYFKDGSSVHEVSMETSYEDQLAHCLAEDLNKCVDRVEVKSNYQFRWLDLWSFGNISYTENPATTTMPAESMGLFLDELAGDPDCPP